VSVAYNEGNMKRWKLLPFNIKKRTGQKGQTLIEFVLLLTVIAGISFGFVSMMNKNITSYWSYAVNLVIDDKPGTKTATLR
jgi:hypothetical protein